MHTISETLNFDRKMLTFGQVRSWLHSTLSTPDVQQGPQHEFVTISRLYLFYLYFAITCSDSGE
jgi:hypothetical protein